MSEKEKNEVIDVDPNLMLDCLTEVNAMVEAHAMLLESVKAVIKKAKKFGLEDQQAASIAITLHKRAAEKASKLVHMNDDEMAAEKEENKDDRTESDK